MMRTVTFLFVAFCVPQVVHAQKNEISRPFSEWQLRLNPFSLFETLGGVHLGAQTNLDRNRRLDFVSEYGYLFVNNGGNRRDGASGAEKQRVSGFETKQEVRWRLDEKGSGNSFAALEVHYVHASAQNEGWFGMGNRNEAGNYPYMKYQYFDEKMKTLSAAMKYAVRFPREGKFGGEAFAGMGLIYRHSANKNTEGKLLYPEWSPFFNEESLGTNFYLAAGFRLVYRIR